MTAALRALLTGVIDYAGLFPPAKLPLEEAVREYLVIRRSPEAWMLNAFVVPANRVDELESWADELFRGDTPLKLALLGQRSDEFEQWQAQLREDVAIAAGIVERHSNGIGTCVWEIPLPTTSTHADSLPQAAEVVGSMNPRSVYCEVPDSPDADHSRISLIRAIGKYSESLQFGFKFRTGGLTPDAFPSVERFAEIIHTCGKHQCRWKATAGLHHPLRRTDAELGVKMHGFLNVLFADTLTDAHSLSESVIGEILADEDATQFQITNGGIRWGEYAATVDQIELSRLRSFQSFGSCSFDEPRDDLKKLGLL